ncbi:hypothetical protein LT330_010687 [Penicillium expansum]|nr:hypothetical protein LT330_010687 [Penicillium expansum]
MNRERSFDAIVSCINDLKKEASKRLPRVYREFHDEGAMDLITSRSLMNVENIDISTKILDSKVSMPISFGPTGMQRLAHTDGEVAVSRAAARKGLCMILATHSTVSLEEVILQGSGNPYGMHLLMLKDRALMGQLVKRAEGKRLNEHRNGFVLPEDMCWPNLKSSGRNEFFGTGTDMAFDPSIDWDSIIPWIRSLTSLQVWIKGVLSPSDVETAICHGIDGVVISNHGGRQLDGVPATLDALRECAPIAKDRIQIAVDGGIRRGSDIFKALAMGAKHCFLGRIPIWGLAYNGQAGVELAVDILQQELKLTMALAGCRSLGEINRSHLTFLQADGLLAKL